MAFIKTIFFDNLTNPCGRFIAAWHRLCAYPSRDFCSGYTAIPFPGSPPEGYNPVHPPCVQNTVREGPLHKLHLYPLPFLRVSYKKVEYTKPRSEANHKRGSPTNETTVPSHHKSAIIKHILATPKPLQNKAMSDTLTKTVQ